VIEETYGTPVITHTCIETHGTVCEWDGDKLTAWISTQGISGARENFASALGIPQANVRVICQYMGGGFGSKALSVGAEGLLCAKLAKAANAPVKLMLDRKEEHLATGNRPSSAAKIKAGVSADGVITAEERVRLEKAADNLGLDRSRLFPGRFHVLGGRLSALEGVRPEDLSIDRLISRVAAGGVDEVVLAMNATLEDQTTAHYLAERLEDFPVRVTQLAHGLPVGGELDYLDEGTLAQALRARRPVS